MVFVLRPVMIRQSQGRHGSLKPDGSFSFHACVALDAGRVSFIATCSHGKSARICLMASSSHDALVANLCCAYVRHVLYAYYVCTARGVWTGWLADVPEASAVPTSSWALAELCSCVFCACLCAFLCASIELGYMPTHTVIHFTF
eukprot:1159939-Pelagomonas_calceolata.AAC.1